MWFINVIFGGIDHDNFLFKFWIQISLHFCQLFIFPIEINIPYFIYHFERVDMNQYASNSILRFYLYA